MYSPCLCDLLKVDLKIKLLSVKMIRDSSTIEDDKNEAADLIVLEAEEENEILEETRKPEEDLKLKVGIWKLGFVVEGLQSYGQSQGWSVSPPPNCQKQIPKKYQDQVPQ